MADTIRRLTSEPSILIIILASLILFKTTFEKEVGTELVSIYLTMTVLNIVMLFTKREGIIHSEIKQIAGNSGQSLLYAGGAVIGFSALYSLVNTFLRQSVLVTSTTASLSQSVFQSAFNGLVKFSTVDFSQLTPVKYYLFGGLIPIVETLTIINMMIFLAWIFDVPNDLKNPRLLSIIALVSVLFMIFHLKVRGINNNIDLIMTFIFSFVSLILVAKTKEPEPANEFHVATNVLALRFGQ